MNPLLQKEDPLQGIIKTLETGLKLSIDQCNQLLNLLELERGDSELLSVFDRCPEQSLETINVSPWRELKKSTDKSENVTQTETETQNDCLRQLSNHLLRFITSLNHELIMSICLNHLTLKPSVYVFIYTECAMKYFKDVEKPLRNIIPLLASPYKDVVMAVTLAVYFYVRKDASTGDIIAQSVKKALDCEIESIGKDQFAFVFTVFEVLLPLLPNLLLPLYTSQECRSLFLFRGLVLDPDTHPEDTQIAEKLLKVISVSCMYEEARKFNSASYAQFLISGTKVNSSATVRSLSCLCLVKIWDFTSLEKKIPVVSILSDVTTELKSIDTNDPVLDPLIEALTYLTLGTTLKSIVRSDEDLINRLLSILKDSPAPINQYGILTIFSNLCKLAAPGASKEDQTRSYLNSMANAQKTGQQNEDESVIVQFNKSLVDSKLVSKFVDTCANNEKFSVLLVQIIYYLTIKQNAETLRQLGVLGVPDFLLKYLLGHSTLDKETGKTKSSSSSELEEETRASAIRALAAVSRSMDPKLLSKEFKPQISVSFLVELFGPTKEAESLQDQSFVHYNALDLLVGLLALTNICLSVDHDLSKLVVQKTFDQYVRELIFDSTRPVIQKAAWELVNNLIDSPFMLAKFFNPDSSSSVANLELLVKFLNSDNLELQEIIAGLLANATSEFTLIINSIIENESIFLDLRNILVQILTEQSQITALMHRIGYFLYNLANIDKAVQILSGDMEMKRALLKAIKGCGDEEDQAVMAEVFRLLFNRQNQ